MKFRLAIHVEGCDPIFLDEYDSEILVRNFVWGLEDETIKSLDVEALQDRLRGLLK